MAKLNRESKLRDKRAEKLARKAARKQGSASDPDDPGSRPEDLAIASIGPDPRIRGGPEARTAASTSVDRGDGA